MGICCSNKNNTIADTKNDINQTSNNNNDDKKAPLNSNNNNMKNDDNKMNDNNNNNNDAQITKRYEFGRTLGKGASCRVVEAKSKNGKNASKVAIKIMSKAKPISKDLYNHEINILKNLKHPNILSLVSYEEDIAFYYIITKLCEGGELFDRIVDKNSKITEKQAAHLLRDSLIALKYCHDRNIVHRDLKPENFVFETKAEDSPIVLIDFGVAKQVGDDEEVPDLVGTVYYLAPELVVQTPAYKDRDDIIKLRRTGKVLKAADVWSMGVIAYVMMTGRPPFKGHQNNEIFNSIIKKQLLFPKDVELSESFKDFVRKILVKNPQYRMSLEDAINHPWIQGNTATNERINKDVVHYLLQFQYQSRLKKAITRLLAASMSKEPEEEVRKHFIRLDKDGDGYLDIKELQVLLMDLGIAESQAYYQAQEILKSGDLNNDNVIDFTEFKAIWYRKLLSKHEEYCHRVFQVFDDNRDGFIDPHELLGVFQGSLGHLEKFSFEKVKQMISEVDLNKDGKINFAEFKNAMQESITRGGLDDEHNIASGAGKANINERINDNNVYLNDNNYNNDDYDHNYYTK
jgi:calcium-dependent protein kinase